MNFQISLAWLLFIVECGVHATQPIEKEVCVLGGGASGAYTAYELQTRGYDVVLMEPLEDLGGNCEIIPVRSTLNSSIIYDVNAAVIVYLPTSVATDFFDELDVMYSEFASPDREDFVYSYTIGDLDVAVKPPPETDPSALFGAFLAYSRIIGQMNVEPDEEFPLPD